MPGKAVNITRDGNKVIFQSIEDSASGKIFFAKKKHEIDCFLDQMGAHA
jgi:hypothetical protein